MIAAYFHRLLVVKKESNNGVDDIVFLSYISIKRLKATTFVVHLTTSIEKRRSLIMKMCVCSSQIAVCCVNGCFTSVSCYKVSVFRMLG